MSLDVENMMVFQDAHPDTPVAFLPRLGASIQWKELIFGRVVARLSGSRRLPTDTSPEPALG